MIWKINEFEMICSSCSWSMDHGGLFPFYVLCFCSTLIFTVKISGICVDIRFLFIFFNVCLNLMFADLEENYCNSAWCAYSQRFMRWSVSIVPWRFNLLGLSCILE